MSKLFELSEVEMRYDASVVLQDVTLTFSGGEFVALAGPNGAGKSTLLHILAGLIAPSGGSCALLDRAAHQWKRLEFARRVAVVQQLSPTAFPFSAEEVVYMGRMPHSKGFKESEEDHAAVRQALQLTGTEPFRARDFRTLSGGEKQRVVLASALAQAPEILLLDEPATHLDLQHQVELHRILRSLSARGLLVVAVTHDLNLASAYASRIVVLDEGRVRKDGSPREVMNAELIEQVFRVRAAVGYSASGHPWILYGQD